MSIDQPGDSLNHLDDLMEQMPGEDASEDEIAAFMKKVMSNEAGAQMINDFAEQITAGGSLDQMLKGSDPEVPPLQSPVHFIFGVDLIGTKIWRRLSLPADASFRDLHYAIQDSFGWMDTHLHEFQIRENGQVELRFSSLDKDGHYCEIQNPLSQVIENGVSSFHYLYDFEDDWQHLIKLEEVVPAGEKGTSKGFGPVIHAGEGLCPPEGCGGVSGFQNFLNGDHPFVEEYGSELVAKIREGKFDPASVRFRE